MARGKKTDVKVKAKIIAEKINNDGSSRDIEEKTGVPHETVAKVLREDFAQVCTESEKIAKLIDNNNSLQSAADAYLSELISNKDDRVTAPSLVSLRESTFKQNQLLTGGITDKIEVNDYKNLSTAELLAMKNKSK